MAPLSPFYPSIVPTEVPTGLGSYRAAWGGSLQPFITDQAAHLTVRALAAGKKINISDGNLLPDWVGPTHWAEPLLVNMTQVCEILILQPPKPAHPRAYLLNPAYDITFLRSNDHPHPRGDQSIQWKSRTLVGLCVYSASEFRYIDSIDRGTQFLDQTLLWVARHLIWLKTRRLYRHAPTGETLVRTPFPGEAFTCPLTRGEFWRGEWFGPRARATTAADHVATIDPVEECWCGSGRKYQACHRAVDLSRVRARLR